MGHVYQTLKTEMIDSELGSAPTGASWKLAVVGSGFSYNSTDSSLDDLEDVLHSDIDLVGVTYTTGRIRANDINLTGLNIGDIVDGLVVYLKWIGGSQLICHLDSTEFTGFPIELLADSMQITWNAQGICQI